MEGFEVTIHRSLTQQILIFGIPRELALLTGTTVAVIVFAFHNLWGVPIGAAAYVISLFATRRDEQFIQAVRRATRYRKWYGA